MSRSWPAGQNPNYYDSLPPVGSFCKGVDHGKRWRNSYEDRYFIVENIVEIEGTVGNTGWQLKETLIHLKDVSLPAISRMERTIPFFRFKEDFVQVKKIVIDDV